MSSERFRSKVIAGTCMGFAMIIVGSAMVFGKIITACFPVCLASGLRFAIAAVILFPLVLFQGGPLFRVERSDLFRLVFMAFCGQFVFTILMLLGLRYTSGIEAGIISATSPAMMVLAAFILFREKTGARQVCAVGMVVIGIIIINTGGFPLETSAHPGHLTGNLMMVGAVMGEAVFLLMRKGISPSISNLDLSFYLCVAGFVMFLPFALYQAQGFEFSGVEPREWWSLVYFGAVFTVLAYLLWFAGVTRVSGTTAGLFSAVMPVSAVTLSCLFLSERFTLAHGMGIILVLGAIAIMAAGPSKLQKHNPVLKA